MSWLFSQALVEEYSVGTSLDGAPCAQLNVMPTPHKFWRNDKMMEFSDLSQFGLTLQLLTDDHGAELLTFYRQGFLAKTSAAQDVGQELTEPKADFGWKWAGSLAKFDHDAYGWKTRQGSLLGDSDEFLETWPNWGLMLDGELLEQMTAGFPMTENEYGSWPTPKARDWRSGGTDPLKVQARIERRKNQGVIDLPDAAVHRFWKQGFSGHLKPSFSESLMDWPIGWTDLQPLAMAKFREWQQRHGISCMADPLSDPHEVLTFHDLVQP